MVSIRERAIGKLVGLWAGLDRLGAFESPLMRRAYVRAYFAYKRWLEDPFQGLVDRHPELFRAGEVIDVGANVGYTTVLFARALPPGLHVHAFEPEQRNFQALVETVERSGVGGLVVSNQAAVGGSAGQVELWLNDHHRADHRVLTEVFRRAARPGATYPVPQVSLDEYTSHRGIQGHIGFIKIDVQGYEPEVCAGMSGILEKSPRAVVAIEYAPESLLELGFSPPSLLDFFWRRGFRVYQLGLRGGLREVPLGQTPCGEAWSNLLCSRQALR